MKQKQKKTAAIATVICGITHLIQVCKFSNRNNNN